MWETLNYQLPTSEYENFCFTFVMSLKGNEIPVYKNEKNERKFVIQHEKSDIVLISIRDMFNMKEYFPENFPKFTKNFYNWKINKSILFPINNQVKFIILFMFNLEKNWENVIFEESLLLNPLKYKGWVISYENSFIKIKFTSPTYTALKNMIHGKDSDQNEVKITFL